MLIVQSVDFSLSSWRGSFSYYYYYFYFLKEVLFGEGGGRVKVAQLSTVSYLALHLYSVWGVPVARRLWV